MDESNLRNRKKSEKKSDSVVTTTSVKEGNVSAGLKEQEFEYANKSLISRQIAYVAPISFAIFFLIHVSVNVHPTFCRHSEPFAENVRRAHLVVSCCFFLAAIHNVGVGIVLQTWRREEMEHPRGVHAAGSVVNVLAGIGTFLSYASMDQRICIDALGVQTYHSQWAEWITTVPLLTYLTIAIEDKKKLTLEDWVVITLMLAALAFGFSINLVTNYWVGVLCFSCSCISISALVSVAVQADRDLKRKAATINTSSLDDELWSYDRTHMKRMLSMLLIYVLPVFPFIYFMGATKVFDRHVVAAANVIASMAAKLVFVGVLTFDSILVQLSLEKKANNSRRRFLRYVFHEVRVPLNTITMGLSVVEADADKLSESSLEALHMMHGAAGFMGGTLNDVLSMSKIEDGAMKMASAPFLLEELVHGAVFTAKGLADAKACMVEVEYTDSQEFSCAPGKLFINGDIFRLEHVLVNFLSNAIKFSSPRTTVTVKVSASLVKSTVAKAQLSKKQSLADILSPLGKLAGGGAAASLSRSGRGVTSQLDDQSAEGDDGGAKDDHSTELVADVRVLVCDQGIGISQENMKKLFIPFGQIRPHELQRGQGSGLGLVLAKEIVQLHGGKIIVDSQEGVGSTFGFSIPFKLSMPPANYKSEKSEVYSELSTGSYRPPMRRSASSSDDLTPLVNSDVSPCTSEKITVKNIASDGTSTTHTLSPQRTVVGKPSEESAIEALTRKEEQAGEQTSSPAPVPSQAPVSTTATNVETAASSSGTATTTTTTSSTVAPAEAAPSPTTAPAEAKPVPAPGPATTAPVPAPAPTVAAGPIMKFLLVDDTLSNRKMLSMLLMRRKIACDMAINGVEAIDAVKEKGDQYDMIFMDNTMPVMCGVEATAHIRALGYENMVVGITGNALDDDVNSFLVAGADGVFAKPFRDDQLTALLKFINEHGTKSSDASRETLKVLTGRANK